MEIFVPATGFGVALRAFRDELGYSIRAASGLAGIDHAYWYRLEEGEKVSPSPDVVGKISRALNLSARNHGILDWLAAQTETSVELVAYTLNDPSVALEEFTTAAGIRFRGDARPEPAVLISRARKALADD